MLQEGGGGVLEEGLDAGDEGGCDGKGVHGGDDVDGGVFETPDYG